MSSQREPSRALLAFERYLGQQAPRSIRRLASEWHQDGGKKGPSLRSLQRWSGQYQWERRAREHDHKVASEAEEQIRAQQVERLTKDKERRRNLASVMLDSVTEFVVDAKTGKRRPIEQMDPQKARVMMVMFEKACHVQRLESGEATNRTEVSGTPGGSPIQTQEVRVLSPEDLAVFERFFGSSEN